MNEKRKANKPEIKVTVKNRPSKDEASVKLKQLGELLSSGRRAADGTFDVFCNK